jgi:hypothetical protein
MTRVLFVSVVIIEFVVDCCVLRSGLVQPFLCQLFVVTKTGFDCIELDQ